MSSNDNCVVCGSRQLEFVEEWCGFEIAKCLNCGLQLTLNPSYRPESYQDAYRGMGLLPVLEEHIHVYAAPAERLQLEERAFILPPPRLTPAERLALEWLERSAPTGAVVIDCGCGTGRFLRALQRKGFEAIGVDLSSEVIELLNRSGLKAFQGKAPDFLWKGEQPFAITFFEVLEHIPDPIPVLSMLKERFPTSAVLASVPSPYRAELLLRGERNLSDYPPNHFLRWTPEALKIAFSRAGYTKVDVILPKPIGSEMLPGLGQLVYRVRRKRSASVIGHQLGVVRTGLGSLRAFVGQAKATAALWILWGYQQLADIVGYSKAWYARRRGASAASMLVIAKP